MKVYPILKTPVPASYLGAVTSAVANRLLYKKQSLLVQTIAFTAIFSLSTYVYYNYIPLAVRFYAKKAADNNNRLAQALYVTMCWNDIGRPPSVSYQESCSIARKYLEDSSNSNYEEADVLLATIYFYGELGSPKNLQLAKYHAEKVLKAPLLNEQEKNPVRNLLEEINKELKAEEKVFLASAKPPPKERENNKRQAIVLREQRQIEQAIALERERQAEQAAEAIEEILEQERETIALINFFINAHRVTSDKIKYYLARIKLF